MRYKISVAVAIGCLFSIEGAAQDEGFLLEEVEEKKPAPFYTSEVEVGIGYNSEDSFKFGEYTGLEEEGPFAIGNVSIKRRDPYDSDSANYFEARGSNLGLDYRSIHLEYGDQGRYGLYFNYDQIPRFQFGDARTPYNGVGSGRLTLPENWVAAPTTQEMAALGESLKSVDIETERKRFDGGLTWHLSDEWTLQADFRHERKDGLDTIGAAFGTNGGNPSAVILPEPIDYETNILGVSLGYVGKKAQFQLGYELSLFNNDEASLTFQNPYSETGRGGAWAPVTGFPTGFGQFALPPDNQAHHLTFSGGYLLNNTTRVTAQASYGRLLQDEAFLPFSAIPALNASITTPLPRSSLDGRIDTLLLDLGLSSRPLPRLDLRANYRYEDQDNETPRDIYVRIAGDAQTQPEGIANANARINLPYSFERHKASLDAGYRLLPWSKLTLGYEYDQRERDLQEVNKTREHTVRARASATPFDFADGWIEYSHGFRDGSKYADNAIFLNSHTSAFLETLPADERFENHPALRKFHLANRDRDSVRGVVTFMPHERIALGLDGSYTEDDYDDSVLGLEGSRIVSATVDASYSPRRGVTGYAFFTYENLQYEQRGHQYNTVSLPSLTDPAQRWSIDTEDDVFTTGVGLNWTLIEDRLDLDLEYTFSIANTAIEPKGGSALTAAPLPDVESSLHRVSVLVGYQLKDNLSARFGYRYETLDTEDFALDGIAPDTLPFVLGLGETSPDYDAHVVSVSLAFEF